MKNVSQIINLLKNNNRFGNLKQKDELEKLKSNLPKNITLGIEFMYIKNAILFFVLKHQIYKIEFEYNKASIKNLLTTHFKNLNASDVRCIVTNKIPQQNEQKNFPLYEEKSEGNFVNNCTSPELEAIFENIRTSIQSKQHNP